MKILLVRHGQTMGNKERRYSGGRTDEPVCPEGLEALKKRKYPKVEHVFASPMLRCLQTAEAVFGEKQPEIIEEFRECDFGILEGKNHEELKDDPQYQEFLASDGKLPFPGGESLSEFNGRCMEGLKKAVQISREQGYSYIGCAVHGGVIMTLMYVLMKDDDFYRWNAGNGEGYIVEIDEERWEQGQYDGVLAGGGDARIYR